MFDKLFKLFKFNKIAYRNEDGEELCVSEFPSNGSISFDHSTKKIVVYCNGKWIDTVVPLPICLYQEKYTKQKEILKQATFEQQMIKDYSSVKEAYDQFQFMINMCKDNNNKPTSEGVLNAIRSSRPTGSR